MPTQSTMKRSRCLQLCKSSPGAASQIPGDKTVESGDRDGLERLLRHPLLLWSGWRPRGLSDGSSTSAGLTFLKRAGNISCSVDFTANEVPSCNSMRSKRKRTGLGETQSLARQLLQRARAHRAHMIRRPCLGQLVSEWALFSCLGQCTRAWKISCRTYGMHPAIFWVEIGSCANRWVVWAQPRFRIAAHGDARMRPQTGEINPEP
jgi:hypothetical protein